MTIYTKFFTPSSILFQNVDTTVLTTEELTTVCLKKLNFKTIIIKKDETEKLLETCSLHVSDSPYYVSQYVKDKIPNHICDMGFNNIFANKCGFADGNLETIKGQHIRGKNLTIIRNLPIDATRSIDALFKSCFKGCEDIDPVALTYKDSLMQAVGRSIGFRGDKDAWVMVHSGVWSKIKDTKWIYKIVDWNVEIDPELKKEIDDSRDVKKSFMTFSYIKRKEFQKEDRTARVKNSIVITQNSKDRLTSKDIKLIFGAGFTLNFVAECLGVPLKKNKRTRYIEGVKRN